MYCPPIACSLLLSVRLDRGSSGIICADNASHASGRSDQALVLTSDSGSVPP